MPELKNFLRILQREEEEHIKQIVQRYALARTKMQEALAGSTPGWDDSAQGVYVHLMTGKPSWDDQSSLHPKIPENTTQHLCGERENERAQDVERKS